MKCEGTYNTKLSEMGIQTQTGDSESWWPLHEGPLSILGDFKLLKHTRALPRPGPPDDSDGAPAAQTHS